jgi:hypothetical protein
VAKWGHASGRAGEATRAAGSLSFLPRGPALLRRVLLAEIFGPPRALARWRSPADRDDPRLDAPTPPPDGPGLGVDPSERER